MSSDQTESEYIQYISSLSRDELTDIKNNINKEKYPERYQHVIEQLQAVEDAPGEKYQKKNKELKIAGIFIGFLVLALSIILFPLPGWFLILILGTLFEKIGLNLHLVGPAGTIDLGAILAAILYVICCSLVALVFGAKGQRYIGTTIAAGSIFTAIIIFHIVSSLIWL